MVINVQLAYLAILKRRWLYYGVGFLNTVLSVCGVSQTRRGTFDIEEDQMMPIVTIKPCKGTFRSELVLENKRKLTIEEMR